MERLYSTTKAGELLGGLHKNDVLRLIRDGKLKPKALVVRGGNKHPRRYIPASEIERFIRELPDGTEAGPAKAPAAAKPKVARAKAGLAAELAVAKSYV